MKVNKKFYKSKTMWAAVLVAVVPVIFPDAKQVIEEHPDYVMGVVSFIFSALRISTSSAVSM